MKETVMNKIFKAGAADNADAAAAAVAAAAATPPDPLTPAAPSLLLRFCSSFTAAVAAAAGLKIMFSLKDTYYKGSACWPASVTSRATEQQFVRSQIRKFKQHPALLGWYVQDEMSIKAGWGADLRTHYRWAVEEDPSHITWACVGADATFEMRRYLDTTDVIGTDKYPICQAYNASSTNNNVATIGPEVALARNQTDSARPLWQVLQVLPTMLLLLLLRLWLRLRLHLDPLTPAAPSLLLRFCSSFTAAVAAAAAN